jgi:Na+/proline symporter
MGFPFGFGLLWPRCTSWPSGALIAVGVVADTYACQPAETNDARPQGSCAVGFVQVNPTVVVFTADIPDASAMTAVFLIGFISSFGGPEAVALITRAVIRIVKSL